MQQLGWARRGVALYLAAWLMLGLLLAALLDATASLGAWTSIVFALPLVLCYSVVCGFSAFYIARAFPLVRTAVPVVLGVFLGAALCAALAWCMAAIGWAGLLGELRVASVTVSPALTSVIFSVGVLLYGMTACAHYLALEVARGQDREKRELSLALAARDAELRLLRTQVDPHFLFNSLNSISALTTIDAAAARLMTLELAGFFRSTLGMQEHSKVTLEQEMDLVVRFLRIEQVRFGARLSYEQHCDPEAAPARVPPMLLQPLVENAVKHGVSRCLDGGMVRVHARRAGSLVRITVENDCDSGTPAPGRSDGVGFGLVNVRQRLAAAYGHHSSVHWQQEGARFRVELVLPFDEAE